MNAQRTRRLLRRRLQAAVAVLAMTAVTVSTAAPANASIALASGDLVQGWVKSVQPGVTQSNDIARVFSEKQDYMLQTPLVANVCRDSGSGAWARTYDEIADLAARSGPDRLCTIPAGTSVDSHFLHSDIVGEHPDLITCDKQQLDGRNFCMFKGTVHFDSAILGVIAHNRQLVTSEQEGGMDLRHPDTDYPGSVTSRDLEFYDADDYDMGVPNPDLFRIVDANTLYVEFGTFNIADQIRVITQGSNTCPRVTGPSITVNEGSPAGNSGTYADDTLNDRVRLRFSSHLGSFSTSGGARYGTWSWSGHTPTDDENGDRTFTVTAEDLAGCIDRATWTMDVRNVAPHANNPGNAEVIESDGPAPNYSSAITFSDPGADEWHATLDFGDGSGAKVFHPTTPGTRRIPISHLYRDDAKTKNPHDDYTVTARVYDDEGAVSSQVQFTVRVHDRAPDFTTTPVVINEGQKLEKTYSYSDVEADLDTMKAGANYLDPAPGAVVPVAVNHAARTFTLDHLYKDDGENGQTPATSSDVYNVPVTLTDKDTLPTTRTQQVTVNNVPPTCALGDAVTIDEGQTFSRTGVRYGDVGVLDRHTARFLDGAGVWQTLALDQTTRTFDLSRVFLDDDASSAPQDTYTLVVELTDDDLGVGTCSIDVTVRNVAPDVTIVAPADIDEGERFTGSWSFTDPGRGDSETWSAVVDYGDGTTTTLSSVTSGQTYDLSHVYIDDDPTVTKSDSYTVTVTVTDDDTGTDPQKHALTVHNVDPAVAIVAGGRLPEAGRYTSTWSFSDPGSGPNETWSAVVDYGDGTVASLPSVAPGKNYDLSHVYIDDNPTGTPSDVYFVKVTVTDDDTGVGSDRVGATVDNVAPTVSVGAGAHIAESDTYTSSWSFTDPGTGSNETWSALVSWGDGKSEKIASVTPGTTYGLSHVYVDDNPTATPSDVYTVTVTVTDDDTGSHADTESVRVDDVAPTLAITAPDEGQLYVAPATVSISAPFTDPGVEDTFTCSIDWDDPQGGAPEVFAGTFAAGSGNCDRTHTFAAAGVYTMSVTVTDDDGLHHSATRMVVVYDPGAGFVSGGGWIDSPAGAYVADPTAVGRASFGFVSKYKKGATRPDGQTEFQFKVGGMNFHSAGYDWLVVTGQGTKAQYKGTGTINGQPGYGVLMTVYDGGSQGPDKLRMKITRTSDGTTVYDNRIAVASVDVDRADPQVIAKGQIVIHT